MKKLETEIAELVNYIRWSRSIGIDTKSKALLMALDIGFRRMEETGASRKLRLIEEEFHKQMWNVEGI